MRDVLVVLFWIWVLVAVAIYGYRIYRRITQGPRSDREARQAQGAQGPQAARGPRRRSTTAPLPEGPIEARLPRSLQDRTPRPATPTLAEALQGIVLPADLLPVVDPGDPTLADGRRARFAATGTNVPTVAVALGEELQRLGFAVDGLGTIGSTRAGLSATREGVALSASVTIDDDTGSVVVELRI